MREKISYTVVEIDLPVSQTGSVIDLKTYDNLNSALGEMDRLDELAKDECKWYQVIVIHGE